VGDLDQSSGLEGLRERRVRTLGDLRQIRCARNGGDRYAVGPQPREQRFCRRAAEVHVEEHDRRAGFRERALGLLDRRGLAHVESLELEDGPGQGAQVPIVVDDEHKCRSASRHAAPRLVDTIGEVAPSAGTGQRYAQELGELWPGVQRALSQLDAIASDRASMDDVELVDTLGRLQYHLHLGSEIAYGLEPPPGAETAHAELADALSSARDATAEVAEAVAVDGSDGLRLLLHEWRGALFRVRLARLRLATPAAPQAAPLEHPVEGVIRPLAAFLLALGGAVAFAGGAVLGLWPLWSAGLVAVVAAVLAYRP
jgi:hypothetical protein